MGLFGDLLEMIGLGGITGVDILFAAMAIVGTFVYHIFPTHPYWRFHWRIL